MVIVIARFRPRPDRLDDFVAVLRDVQAASREDDGCLNYGYHREVADDLAFIAVEEWRDMDALAAHLRTPTSRASSPPCRSTPREPPELKTHVVSETVPLPLP